MGNDNSKSTIENQQMIMQLQQQLINQQTQQQQPQQPQQQPQHHQPQHQQHQQHQQHHQQNRQHYTHQNNNNDMYNRQLPVISPAELSNNIKLFNLFQACKSYKNLKK
mgnify:CR=1 FL=1